MKKENDVDLVGIFCALRAIAKQLPESVRIDVPELGNPGSRTHVSAREKIERLAERLESIRDDEKWETESARKMRARLAEMGAVAS